MPTYCTMRDQEHTPRFLLVDAEADQSSAELQAPVAVPPFGADLTPSAPYWLELPDTVSGLWYLSLDRLGDVQVTDAPPAIGTGLARTNGLSLLDAYAQLWHVSISGAGGVSGGFLFEAGLFEPGLFEGGTGGVPLLSLIWEQRSTIQRPPPQGLTWRVAL
jgi:hypothetical protein